MATADGYILSIPESVLEKLNDADKKIEKIAATSKETQRVVSQAFLDMANGVDPFIRKVEKAGTVMKTGFSKSSDEIGNVSNSIAKAATAINKLKLDDISNSANYGVAAYTGLAKNIEIAEKRQKELLAITKEYETTMSRISSGQGGVVSGSAKTEYINAQQELEANKQLIASYREKQQLIIENQKQQAEQARLLQSLANQEQQRTSLPEQRKNDELRKMNEYYKELEKTSAAAGKAEEAAARASQKAAEKAAAAAKKKSDSEAKKAITAETRKATLAEQAYNRAMMSTEGTTTQRINKLAKLRQAQEQLNATGRNYSTQLNKIASETERLQKANEEAARKTGELKQQQSRVLDTSAQLERKFALLFSVAAIEGYIGKMVKVRGEFELQQRSLQAILQNKDEANALFEKTVQLAIKSPYTIKELITYTKQLAAYRIETSKLYETTKMLADVSSGLGVDMQRMILAFGQVKAANYLRGQELRQFSEAGVNILGELADYFTQLEGRMVSVGEVFEMVSKRMVSFGDVENIFKKLTSQGGIFYNMQAIQAETLQGQLANLEDSFDVMFNEIGKANDGVLKGLVSALRTVVENWEILAVVLKGAATAFVLYTAKVAIATTANKLFAVSAAQAAVAQGGIATAAGKVVNVLSKLFGFVKNNPYTIIGAAAVSGIYYLNQLSKNAQEAREKYDVLNNTIDTQRDKLDNLVNSIKEQKKSQDEANEALKSAKKGTEEYTNAEKKGNTAKAELAKLLNQLKTQFPEIYNSLGKQKDKVDELTLAQKKYNKELETTKTLNYLMQQGVPLFGNDFFKQITDTETAISDFKKAQQDIGVVYNGVASQLWNLLSVNKEFAQKYGQNLNSITNGTGTASEKLEAIGKVLENVPTHYKYVIKELLPLTSQISKGLGKYNTAFEDYADNMQEQYKQYMDFEKNFLMSQGKTRDQILAMSDEERKEIAKSASEFLKSTGIESKDLKDFFDLQINSRLKLNIDLDKKEVQQEFSSVQKTINEQVAKLNKDYELHIKPIAVDEQPRAYMDELLKRAKELKDEGEQAARAMESLYPDKTNQQAAEQLKKQADAVEKLAKSYGAMTKGESSKAESAYEKKLKSQLSLLKQLQSEYEKLRRTQGESEATATLTKEFGKPYSDLFGKPLNIKFDKASIAAQIDAIAATIGGRAGKELTLAFERTSGQMKAEISVSMAEQDINDFERKISEMFSGYEIRVGLEAKGIDADSMGNIFGVTLSTIDNIKKQIEEKYPDITKLGEEQKKSYLKIMKDITNAEQKELKIRLDRFVEYLANSVDKIQQVQNAGGIEISFAKKMFEDGQLSAEQFATIVKNVTDQVNKDISRINVEKFKNSPEYIQAMGDMAAYSTKELQALIAKIRQFIKDAAGNLKASDLKVFTDQIEKAQKQLDKIKSPFQKSEFGQFKEYVKLQKQYKEELENQNTLLEKQKQKQKELDEATKNLEDLKSREEIEGKSEDLTKSIQQAESNVVSATQNLDKANSSVNVSQGKIADISGKMGNMTQGMSGAMFMIDKIVTGIYQSINATLDLMNQFKDLADSTGIDTERGGWREVQQAGEVLGNVNERVMSSWNNFKSGNIAGAVSDAVGSITTIFTTFNRQHDKRREKTIQNEIKKVKDLEREYGKLEDKIDKALSGTDLKSSTEAAQKNIDAQIASYRKMIEAEEDKKKSDADKIKEWNNTIEDLEEQRVELHKQFINELGGLGTEEAMKNAAQDFADAWYESFRETGNGLTGLEESFDDFIDNIVKKQLLYKGAMKILDPLFKQIDKALDDADLTKGELDSIMDKWDNETKGKLDDFFKSITDLLGVSPKGDSDLSTLSQGIQSVTEETAQALEALLNSMRFYVSDSNLEIKNIRSLLSNDPEMNPLLFELKIQTRLIQSLYDMFSGMLSTHDARGGLGLKVVI